ncbi:MAG: DMT family transporter [Bacteroidales bacterium]|nr:DMT family transporter [Bacteroidales bacterium]
MQFVGEIISLAVAIFWTVTALCFEYSSKKVGALPLNLIRLLMAFVMLGGLLFFVTGEIVPSNAGKNAWIWLSVSGLIGFVFGDFCLFKSYILIGSRFTQLMMTLAPPSAAIAGSIILGEKLSNYSVLGMIVTLVGIIISIVGRNGEKWSIKLPLGGLLLAMGAGLGQGIGLVFSKLGMNFYQENISLINSSKESLNMIPFAASQIRIITGIVGFFILIVLTRNLRNFFNAFKVKKAMGVAAVGTFFGPFVGVAGSLMAVQYTQTGIASTLMALTPIIILLPSSILYKQKISYIEILGAFISVVGVALFFL